MSLHFWPFSSRSYNKISIATWICNTNWSNYIPHIIYARSSKMLNYAMKVKTVYLPYISIYHHTNYFYVQTVCFLHSVNMSVLPVMGTFQMPGVRNCYILLLSCSFQFCTPNTWCTLLCSKYIPCAIESVHTKAIWRYIIKSMTIC